MLRALVWLPKEYFPKHWFVVPNDDPEYCAFEDKNTHQDRVARILWLACRIVTALNGRCFRYDAATKRFAEVEPTVKKQVLVPRAASTVVAFLYVLALRSLITPAMARLLDKNTDIAKSHVALASEKALIRKEMTRSYGVGSAYGISVTACRWLTYLSSFPLKRINYGKKQGASIQGRRLTRSKFLCAAIAPLLLISISITGAVLVIIALLVLGYSSWATSS